MEKKRKYFGIIVFVIILCMSSFPVSAAKAGKTKLVLRTGQSYTVSVKKAGAKKKIKWKSSKPSVASVNRKTGKIKAKKPGKCIIYGKAGKKKYKYKVTVKPAKKESQSKARGGRKKQNKSDEYIAVEKIALSEQNIVIQGIGKTKRLTVNYQPENASVKKLFWNSSNTSVVTVSADGLLTSVGEGDAVITCKTDNGVSASVQVSVTDPGCNIKQGAYCINTKLNSKMYLDISGQGTANKTNVQIWTGNGTIAQKFEISLVSDGWYKIISPMSGKCLDVYGGSKESKTNVQLYSYSGSDAQLWRFCDAGNGYYFIKNKLGCFLDVAGGKTEKGTNVWVHTKNYSDAQKWRLEATTVIGLDGIKLNSGNFTLTGIGKTKKLNVTYLPSNTTYAGTDIVWSSSNNKVATVSSGTVKAVNSGTATITAKAYNGKTASVKVTVKTTYDDKVNQFLSDSRWKNGAAWKDGTTPKVSSWSSSGCCAYAADYVRYVFGINGWGKNSYTNISKIKKGDVIYIKRDTGDPHWVVILNRDGDKLKTAEGNWGNKVVVSSSAYTIKSGKIYRSGKSFGVLKTGYHYL